MMDLMAVKTDDGSMPLYLHTVSQIIRDLRLAQQQKEEDEAFQYGEFKRMINDCRLTDAQKAPLSQRLDTLESFMPIEQTAASNRPSTGNHRPKLTKRYGNDWSVKVVSLFSLNVSTGC
jgi:hypothetical protein